MFAEKNNISLDIPFKGERVYLRGADVINEIFKILPDYDEITILFHRLMTYKLILTPLFDSIIDKEKYVGSIHYTLNNKDYCLGIAEDKSSPINARENFNEDKAISNYEINSKNNSIELYELNNGFTFFDYIVVMKKALLKEIISHQIKWAFPKIELFKTPKLGQIKLQLVSQLGTRLVKSAVFVDNELYGYIYFADFKKAFQ